MGKLVGIFCFKNYNLILEVWLGDIIFIWFFYIYFIFLDEFLVFIGY